jgi:hypothetical protein
MALEPLKKLNRILSKVLLAWQRDTSDISKQFKARCFGYTPEAGL